MSGAGSPEQTRSTSGSPGAEEAHEAPESGVAEAPGPGAVEASGSGAEERPVNQAALKRLRRYSMLNMVYSLLAVFALTFVVWALIPNPDEPQRPVVEIQMASSHAATESDWPVWTPEAAVGPDWDPNFAHFRSVDAQPTWQVGLITPSEEYAEISQTADPSPDWLAARTAQAGEESGTRTVTGPDGPQAWTAYEGAEERALVLGSAEGREVTTVVRGTADWAELEEFIGLLEVAD